VKNVTSAIYLLNILLICTPTDTGRYNDVLQCCFIFWSCDNIRTTSMLTWQAVSN